MWPHLGSVGCSGAIGSPAEGWWDAASQHPFQWIAGEPQWEKGEANRKGWITHVTGTSARVTQ